MDLYQKISLLGPSAQYDTCGPKDFGQTTNIPGVYHAKVGGNNICRLFKVLQTNSCKNNCRYCAFRKDRDTPRTVATPDEMAKAFMSALGRRLVDGLFLSSGIVQNARHTMTRLLDTAAILREKLNYRGYLHLKIMPGAPADTIRQSLKLANRISLNIEGPTPRAIKQLSPDKSYPEFYSTLTSIRQEIDRLKLNGQRVPSLTTQFVVGAGEESDREVVMATNNLYRQFNFRRVFYSAFRPVTQTPLSHKPAASLTREHRLYQADFLMRFYRFQPADMPYENGFLSENTDPKTGWARLHPEAYPINLNTAGYWQLLKVPGLGPVSAKKILEKREIRRISSYTQLEKMRLQLGKIKPWATLT